MIRSKYFWLAAIAVAVIPLLAIDIVQHNLDWQSEVRKELIDVVQNVYSFNQQQKAAILDRVFERNQTLLLLIYTKSFAIILLLITAFLLFRLYAKKEKPKPLKPVLYTLGLIALFALAKVTVAGRINTNDKVTFLSPENNNLSLQQVCNANFKNKVVYVDFWGTTCGDCLLEFRDFYQPLKDNFKGRDDICYLYIAQGNEYLWHQQIQKYHVEGYHLFLNDEQYNAFFHQACKDSVILMPHYTIIDKQGNIAVPDAKEPSDRKDLYAQLNQYLEQK